MREISRSSHSVVLTLTIVIRLITDSFRSKRVDTEIQQEAYGLHPTCILGKYPFPTRMDDDFDYHPNFNLSHEDDRRSMWKKDV